MKRKILTSAFLAALLVAHLPAQTPELERPAARDGDPRPPRGPGGFPGGPMGGAERKLVKQFDTDDDKRLNKEERAKAREWLRENPAPQRGPRGGRPGGFPSGENVETGPGPHVTPADVKPETGSFYAENKLRTVFLDFENADWEQELQDFHNTDVEVPATLTVDGGKFPGVGVHFRGASSYFMVKPGQKRSLSISLDFTEKKQRIDGYKSLNLLNSHEDETMMSTVLYSHIAREFVPAPRANFVRVVINGESWGLYANVQQFNDDFLQETFRTKKGARWKVKGSPMGGGGLEYLGDDVDAYKGRFDMKSGDKKDWAALIALCRTLKETPQEQLEEALKPLVDLDELLWFLALDCALINTDGYWIRASDYSIYRDKTGKFQFIPHDMNEAFRLPMGPGFGMGGMRGPRPDGEPKREDGAPTFPEARPDKDGGALPFPPPGFFGGGGDAVKGVELDPLVGMTDERKPLRSKVLAVPALRARYLANVRTIAEKWLDWKTLGPVVAQYRALIANEVAADTRKFADTAAFQRLTADEVTGGEASRRGPGAMELREFADKRREYLLRVTSPEGAK